MKNNRARVRNVFTDALVFLNERFSFFFFLWKVSVLCFVFGSSALTDNRRGQICFVLNCKEKRVLVPAVTVHKARRIRSNRQPLLRLISIIIYTPPSAGGGDGRAIRGNVSRDAPTPVTLQFFFLSSRFASPLATPSDIIIIASHAFDPHVLTRPAFRDCNAPTTFVENNYSALLERPT